MVIIGFESTWGVDVKRKYKIGSVLSAAQARWRTRSISSLIALLNDLRVVLNARIAAETQMQIGMMEGEEHWLLDALIGCGLGNKEQPLRCYGVVAGFIRAAFKLRAERLEALELLKLRVK